jgi:hypothetical protein
MKQRWRLTAGQFTWRDQGVVRHNMSKITALKPLTVVLGTVFTGSLANISISNASGNTCSMQPLSGGYMMLAEGKCAGSRQ